jgi:hypothetical protein
MRLLQVPGLCRSGFCNKGQREASANTLTILQGQHYSFPRIYLGHKPEVTGLVLCKT